MYYYIEALYWVSAGHQAECGSVLSSCKLEAMRGPDRIRVKQCHPMYTHVEHALLCVEKTQVSELKEVPKGSESGFVGEKKPAGNGARKQSGRYWWQETAFLPPGETSRGLEISKWRAECRLSLLHNPKFLKNAKLTECVVIATLRVDYPA